VDSSQKNQKLIVSMKAYISIAIALLIVACKPNPHTPPSPSTIQVDSVYTTAKIEYHGDFYESGHQVYAFDLLSDGLHFDSAGYIVGTGCNLCLSDVFAPTDSISHLPAGIYHMDSTAQDMSFLRGLYFESNGITGSYLLEIKESQIQRITLFTAGEMTIDYKDGDTIMAFTLYTADSIRYNASYIGYSQL
jgi:hypothetical protein